MPKMPFNKIKEMLEGKSVDPLIGGFDRSHRMYDTMIAKGGADTAKVAEQRETTVAFNKGDLTTTQSAMYLKSLGLNNRDVNEIVLKNDKVHESTGIPYSSGRIRWDDRTPIFPSMGHQDRNQDQGGWVGNIGGVWKALPPSGSPAGSPPRRRRRSGSHKNTALGGGDTQADDGDWTEYDAGDLTEYDAGDWEVNKELYTQVVAFDAEEYKPQYVNDDAGDWEVNKELYTQVLAIEPEGNKGVGLQYVNDDAGDWKGNNDKKGEIDLAKRYAISFSEEATENPKLQRDLREGEVDSPSKIYASELSDSSPTPPFGGRRDSESYQEISPTYMVRAPVGFGDSMFGRGVSLLSVITTLGAIVMLVRHWVFKHKKSVVDTKQNEIPAKEREEN